MQYSDICLLLNIQIFALYTYTLKRNFNLINIYILYYFIEDQDYAKLKIGKTPDIHMSMYESY